MKVKKLIELLQQYNGEDEVSVHFRKQFLLDDWQCDRKRFDFDDWIEIKSVGADFANRCVRLEGEY